MRLVKWIFGAAAIWGFVSLPPLYFIEKLAVPPISHPEYYYGFIGVGIAFQLVFAMIARDPVRLRAVIPACMIEKISFVIPLIWLMAQHRVAMPIPIFGAIDFLWFVLFVIAYVRTPKT